jgi:hypothetical protein
VFSACRSALLSLRRQSTARQQCTAPTAAPAPASPANRSDGSALRRAPSFVARGQLPALTDCGAPAWVADGAVEPYPAGLTVVYFDKVSLPQHWQSSYRRSGVTIAPKAHLRRFGRNKSQLSRTRLRVTRLPCGPPLLATVMTVGHTANCHSGSRSLAGVPRNGSDCCSGCRTLSSAVGVLLWLRMRRRWRRGRWWRPRIWRLCLR